MPVSFEEICNKYPGKVSDLAFSLRSFLFKHLPDIAEYIDNTANLAGYGYGSGYKDTLVSMIFSKKGLKLGFYKGATLPDPAKLLKGTGKVHKYVEFMSLDDISNPAFLKLLKEALKTYRDHNTK